MTAGGLPAVMEVAVAGPFASLHLPRKKWTVTYVFD